MIRKSKPNKIREPQVEYRISKTDEKDIFMNPNYRGKHIIIIAGKVFTAQTGREASQVFNRVTKKYPGKTPTITYIPKEDTLILWLV